MTTTTARLTLIACLAVVVVVVVAACESRGRSTAVPTPTATSKPSPPTFVIDVSPDAGGHIAAGGRTAVIEAVDAGTVGYVACAASSCDLRTHECCRSLDSKTPERCVAIGTPCAQDEQRLACDDFSDCKAGLTCCQDWACTGGCPMEHRCMAVPCQNGTEVCSRGGLCREGLTCQLGGDTLGTCAPPSPTIPCGKTACTGGKSCCWNSKTKTGTCGGTCIRDGEDQINTPKVVVRCTGAKSCGDLACARLLAGGFACMGPGIAGDMGQEILCVTVKDCVRRNMAGPPISCLQGADLPPGVKVCDYGPMPNPP